jgi:hypothetical protein
MKESRFVFIVNRVLNVIFASGLLFLWLALLPDGTAFSPLRGKQETYFMNIIRNKIQPISTSYYHAPCSATSFFLPSVIVMSL